MGARSNSDFPTRVWTLTQSRQANFWHFVAVDGGSDYALVHREKQRRMHCAPSTRSLRLDSDSPALPLDRGPSRLLAGRRGRDPMRDRGTSYLSSSRGGLSPEPILRAIPRARRNSARVAPLAGISPHVQEDSVPPLQRREESKVPVIDAN